MWPLEILIDRVRYRRIRPTDCVMVYKYSCFDTEHTVRAMNLAISFFQLNTYSRHLCRLLKTASWRGVSTNTECAIIGVDAEMKRIDMSILFNDFPCCHIRVNVSSLLAYDYCGHSVVHAGSGCQERNHTPA